MQNDILSDDQKRRVLKAALEGKTLKVIREELGIDIETFHRTKRKDKAFAEDWEEARLEGFDERADALLDLSRDETIAVDRAKLISDNTRWLLSKQKAKTYGDKIDLNVSKQLDLGSILQEARERKIEAINDTSQNTINPHFLSASITRSVIHASDLDPTVCSQIPEKTNECNALETDSESVDPFS